MKLFVTVFITYLIQCRGEQEDQVMGSVVPVTENEAEVERLFQPILPTDTETVSPPVTAEVEIDEEEEEPAAEEKGSGKYHQHQFYSSNGKHKSKKLPTTMFEKVIQMQEPVYDTACPKILQPSCAVTNGSLTVYSNSCVLMKLRNEDPSKEYRPISNECCAVYWKYCTQPALNVT